jgi:hypothetical protein
LAFISPFVASGFPFIASVPAFISLFISLAILPISFAKEYVLAHIKQATATIETIMLRIEDLLVGNGGLT